LPSCFIVIIIRAKREFQALLIIRAKREFQALLIIRAKREFQALLIIRVCREFQELIAIKTTPDNITAAPASLSLIFFSLKKILPQRVPNRVLVLLIVITLGTIAIENAIT